MATYQKFNSFVEAEAEKVHNLGADSLKIALCSVAPVAANSVLTDLTQISYTNLSARVLTTSSSSQGSGTYKLILADLILSASGGAVAAFQYVVIYNDTATNKELIGFYSYGSALTLNDLESLTLDFDGTNGVFSKS